METCARVVTLWICRHEAQLTVDGRGDDRALALEIEGRVEEVLVAGAWRLVIDVHRVTGPDVGIVELLAATCHRVGGRVDVLGLRHRLVTCVEVHQFPEIFGAVPAAAVPRGRRRRGPDTGPRRASPVAPVGSSAAPDSAPPSAPPQASDGLRVGDLLDELGRTRLT